MEEHKKKKPHIGTIAIIILAGLAVIADLVGLIPGVDAFLAPAFWVLVNIYLFITGHGIINTRRLVTSIISTIAEMIPVVQEFPLITVGIVLLIILLRIEEKTGISLTSLVPGSKGGPLNKAGVRLPTKTAGVSTATAPLNMSGVRLPSGGLKPGLPTAGVAINPNS